VCVNGAVHDKRCVYGIGKWWFGDCVCRIVKVGFVVVVLRVSMVCWCALMCVCGCGWVCVTRPEVSARWFAGVSVLMD